MLTTIELEDKGGLGAEVVNAAGLAFEEIASFSLMAIDASYAKGNYKHGAKQAYL